jgi:hypothetical protein
VYPYLPKLEMPPTVRIGTTFPLRLAIPRLGAQISMQALCTSPSSPLVGTFVNLEVVRITA